MKKVLLFLVVIALNAFAVTSAEVEKSWDNMVNAMAEMRPVYTMKYANELRNQCLSGENCLACEKFIKIPIAAASLAKFSDSKLGTKLLGMVESYANKIYDHGCHKIGCKAICDLAK